MFVRGVWIIITMDIIILLIDQKTGILSALNQHVSWLSYEPLSVMNQQNDDIYRNYDLDAPYEHCAGL